MTQKHEGIPKSPAKKWALRLLRAALAAAPIAWIYTRTDAAALYRALPSVNVPALIAVLALITFNMLLQGVKWWALIRRFVPELKFGKAVSVHLESVFYSIVLPSAAHDIVKSAMLSKTYSPSVVWASTWLAKLMGLFSHLAFSVIGFVYLTRGGVMPTELRTPLLSAAAVIVILGAASFSKKLTRPVRAAAAKIISPKIMNKIEKLREGIYAFKYARKTLAATFLLSVVTHFLLVLCASLAIYTVCGDFYFIECLAFVPLVEIMVVAIPLTPGGVGIREGLMALLFTQLGFTGEQTALYVTVTLFASTVKIFGGIPPLLRLTARRRRPA